MASLLLRGFRTSGHAADVARTGEDAVWMAAAATYDAIVLDVMLPRLDGWEPARWMCMAFASLSGRGYRTTRGRR